MTLAQVHSIVRADGTVSVPVSRATAGQQVLVTVASVDEVPSKARGVEYHRILASLAGSWADIEAEEPEDISWTPREPM